MAFDGLTVLALESRRAAETEKLISNQGGIPFVAPSMREIPLESNTQAFEFGRRLFDGEFDMVILLTGVGTRYLDKVLTTRYPEGRFAEGLRGVTVVVRGPKPLAVCREMSVPVALVAPEPNTWREVLAVTQGRAEHRLAVQEYGKSNTELIEGLRARGSQVTAVPVYQWALPEDTSPLRQAVHRLAQHSFDAVLFTTSAQVDHLLQIAEAEGVVGNVREGLDHAVIASIGPTTSEALDSHGIKPDFEPGHAKLGVLVVELGREIRSLQEKKSRSRM